MAIRVFSGIGDIPSFPPGLLANLAAPFRWARVQREAQSPPVPA
jgi:hypothetical protein